MAAASISRGSRRFALAGVAFLVCFQLAALAGHGRRFVLVLGICGFVLHVVFGKAYALLPTYFARDLAVPAAPRVQFPLAAAGVALLALAELLGRPTLATAGAVLWAAGVLVFLAAVGWTVRDNPTGRETGTGEAAAHRRTVDRVANAFVPVVLLYLLAGTYELLATVGGVSVLPPLVGQGAVGVAHLYAAGTAATLLFAVGFRVLPRFLSASQPVAVVAVVLPAGALAPALLVADFYGTGLFHVGAALESVAVVGFALAYVRLYLVSDSTRVGIHAVLAGVLSGVAGVALGFGFAVGWVPVDPAAALAHLRLNVVGLLGLAIVGVLYQFYPPAAGDLPVDGDRAAAASIALLAGGLWLEAAGNLADLDWLVTLGSAMGLVGAVVVLVVVGAVFQARRRRDARRREDRQQGGGGGRAG